MASDSKEVMSRVGRTLLAVELQHGTQRSCAVAYAMLIAAHAASGREVWWPINEAVAQRFGPGGRERVKEAAWAIHDAAVEEQEQQMPTAGGVDA